MRKKWIGIYGKTTKESDEKENVCRFLCTVIVLLFFLVQNTLSYGQKQMEGRVFDDRKQPIPMAVVFLEGTTCWATTDDNGAYRLDIPADGWFDLSVSHMSFETEKKRVDLSEMDKNTVLNFTLRRKKNMLDEVVITEKAAKIKERYKKKFWKSFLGKDFEKHSLLKVLNEEVVRFDFDENARTIIVTATAPIEVENNFLGYRVIFDLDEFTHSFRRRVSHTIGNSYFTELKAQNEKQARTWEENRRKAYRGSVIHFSRSLYEKNVEQEGFQIYRVITDSIEVAKEKERVVPPKKREEKIYPERLFYYNWTRPLLFVSRPYLSDSLYLRQKYPTNREIELPGDLFVMYTNSHEPFMKKYYYKGITSRQSTLWDRLTEESYKPERQFYLICNRKRLHVFRDGSIIPSNAWVANNVSFYGIQFMLPYNYSPKKDGTIGKTTSLILEK